jgi:hypothetical protein
VTANCKTINSKFNKFKGNIQNISASGIFIKTDEPLSVGKKLSSTFKFPKSQGIFAATGKIVRVSNLGTALELKVIFSK